MLEIGTSKSLLNKTKGKYINYSLGKAWADIDANTCLFAWWRKDCQSFQICLFASFTSCRYGCVLRAMSSCVPSSLFSFLDDFEALAHCLAPHSRFGSAIGHGRVPGKSRGVSPAESIWRALGQQALSHLLSMDLLPLPAACSILLGFTTIWTTAWLHHWFQQLPEICFISYKIRVNLGYFLKYHLLT